MTFKSMVHSSAADILVAFQIKCSFLAFLLHYECIIQATSRSELSESLHT